MSVEYADINRPTLTDLKWVSDQNNSGHLRATHRRQPWPFTSEEFEKWLLDVHREMFHTAEPAIAGRFRNGGEQVTFGRDDQFSGTDSCNIRTELTSLYRTLSAVSAPSKATITRQAAFFLERYFMIHPFVDGNGRVGRLLIDTFARHHGFYFRSEKPKAKDARQYEYALTLAHKHSPLNNHPQARPVCASTHLRRLEKWLDKWIVAVDEPDEEEQGP